MSETPASLAVLLERTALRDHAAFAQVYERTHAHLFGIAVRILGRGDAAEDALQEAFVNVWNHAPGYRRQVAGQELQPMTWLIAIVRNKSLDALRRRGRDPLLPMPEAPDDGAHGAAGLPSALELFEQAAQAARIQGCLADLGARHRQCLALAYYQGLTQQEVAAHLGAPLGSVKAWIRRGLDRLRHCLAEQGVVA